MTELSSRAAVHSSTSNAIRLVAQIASALAIVAATTLIFSRFVPVNATTAGFFYLVAILMIATAWGFVESTIASVAAMLCFNFFFLPPVSTFTIADPQNWAALFALLATSLTASRLSARAKQRTKETIERKAEMEKLYALSRGMLLTDMAKPMANQIVQQIAQALELSWVALFERESGFIYRAGADDVANLEAKMRDVAMRSIAMQDEKTGLTITPVRLGGEPIGSLAVRDMSLSDAALQSLLNLVAISMERAHSQAALNRAEVARQSEELKSTLLDAIAHEFKTPLTSIKAVTTDLLSEPSEILQQPQRELISIADESADRLSRLVTDAIQLARIEGGTFKLNRGVHLPTSLVSAAIKRTKSLADDREIRVQMDADLPPVWVDASLIEMVIAHLIDNALKYSRPGTPIDVQLRSIGGRVCVSVGDRGAGIPEDEQSRIFEKFYRAKTETNLKGTGMGLAIAREIIRAHGEELAVKSRPDEGSEFSFELPLASESEMQ